MILKSLDINITNISKHQSQFEGLPMIAMIFACDLNGAIGKDGDLPWRQSSDLRHFKMTTINKTVVMGRKTWDSLPPGGLPNRRNIVMSRASRQDVEVMDYEQVLQLSQDEDIIIIGGGEIYSLFLQHCKEIFRTIIHTSVEDADTFAPEISKLGFVLIGENHQPAGPHDQHPMTFQHYIC
jgi:dihydrofolate reductase